MEVTSMARNFPEHHIHKMHPLAFYITREHPCAIDGAPAIDFPSVCSQLKLHTATIVTTKKCHLMCEQQQQKQQKRRRGTQFHLWLSKTTWFLDGFVVATQATLNNFPNRIKTRFNRIYWNLCNFLQPNFVFVRSFVWFSNLTMMHRICFVMHIQSLVGKLQTNWP